MLLISCRSILMYLVITASMLAMYAQGGALSVYVADFRSDDQVDPKLLTRMGDDFEYILSESGTYNLFERRRIGDLKEAIRNEANLRDDPQLVRQLRSRGVDAVVFGRVQNDVDVYALYATLVRLDSSIVWKQTSTISPTLVLNREQRLAALRKLVPTLKQQDPPPVKRVKATSGPTLKRGEATYTFEWCKYTDKNLVQCKISVTSLSRRPSMMMRIKPHVAMLADPTSRTVRNNGEAEHYNLDTSRRQLNDPLPAGQSAYYLIDFSGVNPGLESATIQIYNLIFQHVAVAP